MIPKRAREKQELEERKIDEEVHFSLCAILRTQRAPTSKRNVRPSHEPIVPPLSLAPTSQRQVLGVTRAIS
jgi:hypothetical protein